MSPNAQEQAQVLASPQMSRSSGSSENLSASPSATESDVEALLIPEELLEEEKRLRAKREEAAEKQAATSTSEEQGHSPLDGPLNSSKFKELESLLSRTGQYTRFLTEQIQVLAKPEDEPGPSKPAAPAKVGTKRSSGQGKKASKKVKVEGPLSPTQELAPGLSGDLRDYQIKGVRWMISLYRNGLNGILADQMGLGKTVQVIAFLTHLRSKGVYGPHLVVGPLSVLPNWVNEIKRWAPEMPVVLYHGTRQERQAIHDKQLQKSANKKYGNTFPVIVTSYEILMADATKLATHDFKYMVVDEGHRLKNSNCKLIRLLKTIPTQNKLLLTGTPLQNNLGELWSLLHFLLPDVFSSLYDFESWFDFADPNTNQEAADQRRAAVEKLHDILKPFLLRRIKADVEISLPAKQEIIMYAQMTELQRQINNSILEKDLGSVMKLADMEGVKMPSATRLNNLLMQLRKNCNHPDLITGPLTGEVVYPTPDVLAKQCGKLALLDRILNKLKAGDHKVLIFSQMTSMLDILDTFLQQQGHKTCRIDGSISWQDRQESIKSFNEDPEAWVFLLSTRAGGLGINLTAADTCIIYDSDWNPQQDLQAMDRCHRIGQTKPVLVLRLATAHSCEGRMLQRAAEKMALEKVVMKKGVFKELVEGEGKKGATGLRVQELQDLLLGGDGQEEKPGEPQSGVVSDEVLDQLLNRSHMVTGTPTPYPAAAPGYQVVQGGQDGMLLRGVE